MIGRIVRFAKMVGRDERLPLPLRALVLVGALPIPGPLDELLLVAGIVPLLTLPRWRGAITHAWRESDRWDTSTRKGDE